MKSFAYHRATSLANAAAVLKAHTEARVLAGGMTLLPTMKLGLAQPTDSSIWARSPNCAASGISAIGWRSAP